MLIHRAYSYLYYASDYDYYHDYYAYDYDFAYVSNAFYNILMYIDDNSAHMIMSFMYIDMIHAEFVIGIGYKLLSR